MKQEKTSLAVDLGADDGGTNKESRHKRRDSLTQVATYAMSLSNAKAISAAWSLRKKP